MKTHIRMGSGHSYSSQPANPSMSTFLQHNRRITQLQDRNEKAVARFREALEICELNETSCQMGSAGGTASRCKSGAYRKYQIARGGRVAFVSTEATKAKDELHQSGLFVKRHDENED